jgi:hypothetical protein
VDRYVSHVEPHSPVILCHSSSTPPNSIFAACSLPISSSVMADESVLATLPCSEPGGNARKGFSIPFLLI